MGKYCSSDIFSNQRRTGIVKRYWSDNKHKNLVEFLVCVIPKFSISLSRVYTRRTNDEVVNLQSCFLDELPRPTDIMVDKGLNMMNLLPDLYICPPQEEQCTSFPWGDSKIYTSGTIADSQRMLPEIIKSGTIAKVRVLVESYTVTHWKTFRIISSEMPIWFLLICW